MTNPHKDGMDYLLGLTPDRQTDENVSALLVAANALARASARASRASNGADAHLRKGVLDWINRELARVRRRAA